MHECTHMHMSPATYDHRNSGAQKQKPEEHGSKDSGMEQRRREHRDSESTGTHRAQGLRAHTDSGAKQDRAQGLESKAGQGRDSRAKQDRAQDLGSEGTWGATGTKELGSIRQLMCHYCLNNSNGSRFSITKCSC